MFPHSFQTGEEEEGDSEKASGIQSASMGQCLEPRSQSMSLEYLELGKPEEPGAGSSTYLEQHFSSGCAAALPGPIYVSSRGWAGRQPRPCCCSLVPAPMWNLEFKDQLCPWGRTNRVGKQEAAGAAGPGIKGSGGRGRGWLQACRS